MKKNDIEAFAACELFAGIKMDEAALIAADFAHNIKCYKKHEDIYTPQSYTSSLAVVLSGRANVYKHTDRGELFLSILVPGSVFGMAALFYEGDGFINTVTAREKCRVLFISKQQLEQLFLKYPLCVNNYITLLSRKIHYLNSKISSLTSPTPWVRLLSYLKTVSEQTGNTSFTLPVSYSELASMLSLGRTSLYAAFDELSAKGIAKRNDKVITLL